MHNIKKYSYLNKSGILIVKIFNLHWAKRVANIQKKVSEKSLVKLSDELKIKYDIKTAEKGDEN